MNDSITTQRVYSKGKFEGENIYVPYFWELGIQGFYDEELYTSDDSVMYKFNLSDEDRKTFKTEKQYIVLIELENGFVIELDS